MKLASAQVLERIAHYLGNAFADTGMQVLNGRNLPVDQADLDCYRVSRGTEAIELLTVHRPATQQHTLSVDVECLVQEAGDVDGRLDVAVESALKALFADDAAARLDPLPNVSMALEGIDYRTDRQADYSIGIATISLAVTFRTRENNPSALV